jgi:hypothetical protein
MGVGYVGRSTVSEWVNHNRVPRDPMPTVVAHVLSQALGRELTLGALWQGRAGVSRFWVPALEGLETEWGPAANLRLVSDWLSRRESVLDYEHRVFLDTWGDRLIDLTWSYVDSLAEAVHEWTPTAEVPRAQEITASMVAICSSLTQKIRRLDDSEGGNIANVRFVHRYLLAVGHQLRSGNAASPQVTIELVRLWMQLCQISGWMAYDAEQHGLAQRYYYSALHAARAYGDSTFGSHVLVNLAHQAIYRGKPREATELANAAVDVAKSAPPTQRALASVFLAHTQAAAGNAHGFESAFARSFDLVTHPDAVDSRPDWLYWFDTSECLVRRGHALLSLSAVHSHRRSGWLTEAADLLRKRATVTDPVFPREAVYNRVWLARSYLWRGEVEQAIATARETLRPAAVRSPRSITQLKLLSDELASRPTLATLSSVTEFCTEVRHIVKEAALRRPSITAA